MLFLLLMNLTELHGIFSELESFVAMSCCILLNYFVYKLHSMFFCLHFVIVMAKHIWHFILESLVRLDTNHLYPGEIYIYIDYTYIAHTQPFEDRNLAFCNCNCNED